jgi:hypothetical protein
MMEVRSGRQLAVAAWTAFTVALLFIEAIVRLGARAVETLAHDLDGTQRLAAAAIVAVFCYVEGYRALQRRFVPVVVARALEAAGLRTGWTAVVWAPLYALSLTGAPGRVLGRAWAGVGAIVLAVLLVRALPSPWRGIVDAGVTAALLWGLVALLLRFVSESTKVYRSVNGTVAAARSIVATFER